MHNNIMAAGSRDRPPMLATGRYAQWQLRFMRYADTKGNNVALKKCILQGPYVLSEIIIPVHFDAEAKAIHLILTGIGDDIYSNVDACTIANDMWIAIQRLQQGESLNKQDVKTNLFWEFGIFTSRDGESIEYYYSREICADKIAKNANILALVAAAQQYPDTYNQPPKSHKSYTPPSKQSSSTRSYSTTRHKGKEIAKPITPPSESAFEEDSDLEQAQKGKEMQKNLALIAKNQRTLTVAGARETVGNQEVITEESRSDAEPLEKVQSDTEYNVFANERQYSRQPESINDTYVVEKVDSNVIPDSSDICDNDDQADQNAEDCEDECVVLANLIANLKLDTDENKKIQKQLKKATHHSLMN
ncbi:hypothetical protein Tco_1039938 [Tanacetum coccineum]